MAKKRSRKSRKKSFLKRVSRRTMRRISRRKDKRKIKKTRKKRLMGGTKTVGLTDITPTQLKILQGRNKNLPVTGEPELRPEPQPEPAPELQLESQPEPAPELQPELALEETLERTVDLDTPINLQNLDRVDTCLMAKHRKGMVRIGTESQFGEVYKIPGQEFVLKIMPLMEDQTREQVDNEYKIAHKLSLINSNYFAEIPKAGYCEIYIDPKSKFFDKANDYEFFNGGDNYEINDKLAQRLRNKNISPSATGKHIKEDATITAFIMVIEALDMDLIQYIELYPGDDKRWIVDQLKEAITIMHDANISHNDLHCGNILIKDVGGRKQLKIIDFGRSEEKSSGLDREDKQRDYTYIKNSLIKNEEEYIASLLPSE